jgi:transcriptional regulator with XRE-family HTH domain
MALTSTFTDQLSLGERLARARKATGLGQRDFSRVVGISTRSVSAYELDDRAPSFETVVRWAVATGAPVSYFADAIATQSGGPNTRYVGLAAVYQLPGQLSLDDHAPQPARTRLADVA